MTQKSKAITKQDLRVWLAQNNTKLADVARRLGYEPGTVHVAVFRYLDTDREPRAGSVTAEILSKLQEEVRGHSDDPANQSRAASA